MPHMTKSNPIQNGRGGGHVRECMYYSSNTVSMLDKVRNLCEWSQSLNSYAVVGAYRGHCEGSATCVQGSPQCWVSSC